MKWMRWAAVAAFSLAFGTQAVRADTILFAGTIENAFFNSGITGKIPLASTPATYSGSLGTDQNGFFSVTLNIPSFEIDLPGCGTFASGCSNYVSPTSLTVHDDGSPYASHSFSQTGNLVNFAVLLPREGSIHGSFDVAGSSGEIIADFLYAGSAFRGDNYSSIQAVLSVGAVPLPASFPMFAAGLLIFGVLSVRKTPQRGTEGDHQRAG